LSAASDYKVVIPARYGSTRLPGKPLLDLGGKPLLQHVYERARASGAAEIVVATDDKRIVAACQSFGADVALTSANHHSGSDRIAEVIRARGWDVQAIVVNLQGDEPCMPPTLIDQVAGDLATHPNAGIATLAFPIADVDSLFDPHVVKVVRNAAGLALYFSRAPIPWHRDEFLRSKKSLPQEAPFLRHIGLYAYRAGVLERLVQWPAAPLELAESLEQLRCLWNGEAIYVGLAREQPGPGVDTAADLQQALALLAQSQA
jgi:3-deoxy-manno-octulosonate cytidylyltransferase (CMP-KDO synthetase)